MSLILDKVNYIYNPGTSFERHALKDITLKIPDGEFIGIIGHTGSGKSTLLQHMNGLIKPSSGAVYYNGRDISEKDFNLKELRSKVGLVFQYPEHQLFEETVVKDVLFGPGNLDLSGIEREKRAYDALALVGIDESLLDVSPFDLSGGQKRRVAIAGVLAMQPEILILDEPAAGLDPAGRREILGLISKIQKERKITVILVSHSMDSVAELVERIIVMNEGAVVMDDAPSEIFTRAQELKAMGLGIPAMAELAQNLREMGIEMKPDTFTVESAYGQLVKVIR